MDQKILKQLEEINKKLANVFTKDEAGKFATKDDLKSFAAKDDLKNLVTKDDAKNFLTKNDAKNFATKADFTGLRNDVREDINLAVVQLRNEFKHDIEEAVGQIVSSIVPHVAEKKVVEDLEKRVTKLETRTKIN